jgi:hypothetical protein
MPTLKPEKLSTHLSEAPEIPVRQEVEARLGSLDPEWRELKKFLKDDVQNSILTEKPDSQVYMNNLRQEVKKEASTSENVASPPLPSKKIKIAGDPLEEEEIIEGLRKSYEETKIFERLARLESQYRRLTFYGSIFSLVIVALLFGSMLFSISLARKNVALQGNKSVQTVRQIIPSQPTEKGSPSVKSAVQPQESSPGEPQTSPEASPPGKKAAPAPAEDHSAVTGPSQELPPSAAAPKTSALPAGQESLAVTNTPQEPQTPAVTYVGSITSNKYHYPECKWAKTIIPRKIRVFHSVAEAKKAGYIRCPVCQPPLTDGSEQSTRNDLPPATLPSFKLGLASVELLLF